MAFPPREILQPVYYEMVAEMAFRGTCAAQVCSMKTNTKVMKQFSQFFIGAVLGITLLSAGCAGSRYERSTGESIDDRATVSRVRSALSNDAIYKYPDVEVSSFKGSVQLSGFVDNQEQKSRAGDIAKGVEGVKELKNSITVKP